MLIILYTANNCSLLKCSSIVEMTLITQLHLDLNRNECTFRDCVNVTVTSGKSRSRGAVHGNHCERCIADYN